MMTPDEMLDFERHRPLDPQHQRGGLRVVLVHAARPDHAHRLGMVGDLGADDLGPVGDELGRREALLGERIRDRLARRSGSRAWHACGRACSRARGSVRSERDEPSSQTRGVRRPAAPDPALLLAWYDRHRRVLPWRAAKGETADPYRRLALRDHAAADHREGGRSLLCALPGALSDRRARSRRRRSTMCSSSGPGLATTPAPATCMPARRRSWRSTAANFPTPRTRLRDAARHRRLYGGGDRGDRVRPARRARSTAISSA